MQAANLKLVLKILKVAKKRTRPLENLIAKTLRSISRVVTHLGKPDVIS